MAVPGPNQCFEPPVKWDDCHCEDDDGVFNIQVENGNLNIDVQNGDLNLRARNVNIEAKGDKNDNGNLTVVSNGLIDFKAQNVKFTGADTLQVQSNNMLRLLGDVETDFITGVCNMNSYSSRRGKKGETQKIDTTQGEIA